MTDTDTKISANRQPESMTIDYVNMLVFFSFDDPSKAFKRIFHVPISAYTRQTEVLATMGYEAAVSVSVDEDDIKALCLKENHSLANFEAIRLGLKSFLRDHEVYTVNGDEYRVRREDILCEIVRRAIKGERVPKAENAPESEAA